MANITLRAGTGFSSLILQPGAKTVLRRNGIAEMTAIYLSQGDPGFPFVPLYTPYPGSTTGGFVCDSYTKDSLPGNWWRSTVVFVSIYVGPTSYITFDSKVIQVPIDQSPNFIEIAGTPSAPLNGAVYDANGQFIGFGADNSGNPSQYQGVVTAFITQTLQIVHGSGSFPATPDPNLFCESITNTLRGGVWEYEITYNLSISSNGIAGGSIG